MAEIDDIFGIENIQHNSGTITANLTINKKSAIFEGHFPGQPVVPGACMMQLVKAILCDALNLDLLMKKAGNIKFISMLTPENDPNAYLTITYKEIEVGNISVNAKITSGDITYFKLQATYTKL